MPYKNHLSVGSELVTHRGKTIASGLISIAYQNFVENLHRDYEFEEAVVTPQVEHRPDLISDAFYDTVDLDWLVLLSNGISDPFEGLNIRDVIKLPLL
tara:strand:- start:20946 stop:21239 length:294 start_codon:yes stop_codon:yes gene_type:complete